jgi:hypothetical protein
MRTLGLTLTCALALGGSAQARTVIDHRSPSTRGGAHTLTVGPVFELKLTLHAGQSITCRTQNLSPGADPVLHMLKAPSVFGAAVERARDDDSGGGLNARLRFRTVFPGTFILLLRAAGATTQGTADLFCDDRPVAVGLPVGGAFKRLQSVRPNETLVTVPLPKAPTAHVLYVFGDDGRLLERHPSGRNESVSRVLGVRPIENVMVADLWPDITGPIRLVRNDNRLAGHDPDGDGLGTELEKDAGTCSTRIEIAGDFECSRAADLRDTDGDGLRDDLELLGLFTPDEPFQLLPRWGADPRHKDLFIEVDSMARSHTDPPHILSPANAKMLAASYADPETSPLLRLLHAQFLVNPDRQPGIRLHLDTGVRPADTAPPEEHALFGDWGGHTVVPPVCDDDGNCHGADGPTVWRSHMHPNRFGIFHYALGDAANGGQAPVHSIALNMPVASPGTAAHELGHTLGLNHFGPHRDGAVDANCKPNYPSVMNYGYENDKDAALFNTFADGQGRPTLNNVALRERGAVPSPGSVQGGRYLNDLAEVFGFNVDAATGDVDWNRDGVISDAAVRAYANDSGALGGQCEFTRVNAMRSKGRTEKALTLTRLGDRTIILYLDQRDGRLWLDFTTDALTCPDIQEPGCGPALTRHPVDETWNRFIPAMDAHPVSVDGERRLLLVFRNSAGILFETTMSDDLSFSAPRRVPGTERAAGDLSLTGNDEHTLLAFKNTRGVVVTKVRHSAPGAWDPDEIAHDESGQEIGIVPDGTSPAILEATHADGTRVLYGAFALGPRGALFIHRQDPATGRWIRNAFSISTEERVLGRPAMTFEPVGAGSPLPGRLRVLFVQRTDDGKKPIRELTLQASGLGPLTRTRLVSRFHDNSDLVGDAVDLLFEPGVDSNVRAVVATALGQTVEDHFIQLRPKADGIVDLVQKNANDWETLGVELCRTLFLGGARVRCPGLP